MKDEVVVNDNNKLKNTKITLDSEECLTLLQKSNKNIITKPRNRLKAYQTEYLVNYYRQEPNPKSKQRMEIANYLNLKPQAIQIWFQNRRAKTKRENQQDNIKFEYHHHLDPIDYNVDYNLDYSQNFNWPLYHFNNELEYHPYPQSNFMYYNQPW